jgi:hypothetical protein
MIVESKIRAGIGVQSKAGTKAAAAHFAGLDCDKDP